MCLSCATADTLSVEYWRDLEIWIIGHATSVKMVPFESLSIVSYSHSTATMAVSLAVSTQYTDVTDTTRQQKPCLDAYGLHCVAKTTDTQWLRH